MISFESDYIEGAHPLILEKFIETNYEQLSGYGSDHYTVSAKEKIKELCQKDVDVHFLTGGTQTNMIVIDTILKGYEGVISASSGHINVHEAGAVEFLGRKVLELPQYDGKIKAQDLKDYLVNFYNDGNHSHMVYPGMCYISHPSEFGTLYSKNELKELQAICKEYKIPLFIDGARLGYGIASKDSDVSLADIANYSDVFYLGGTKVGALCGEAVVFTNHNTPSHFTTLIKQHGALLAKGRLLGIQFDTLFTNNLYFEISKSAMDKAYKLKEILTKYNFKFYIDSPTNQQFIIIDNKKMEELSKYVKFSFWEKYDEEHTVIRFVTSWATKEESLEELDKILSLL